MVPAVTAPNPSSLAAAAAGRARFAPAALLLAGGVLFGLTYSLYKTAADHGIPVFPFVFWQSLLAGVAVYLIGLARRRPMKFDLAHLRVYFILGVFGMGIPHAVVVFAAPHLPAGILGLNVTIEPALTYLLALALALESLRLLRVLGLVFAAVGVLLIVLPEASLPSRGMALWVVFSFTAPLCFGIQNVLTERYWPVEGSTSHLSGGMLLGSALFMLPFMAATDSWWFFEGAMDAGDWALLGSVAINVAGTWIFLELIRTAGAVFAASVTYLETLAAVGWGMLLFDERYSVWIWGAIVLLFLGLTLIHRTGRRAVARHHAAP